MGKLHVSGLTVHPSNQEEAETPSVRLGDLNFDFINKSVLIFMEM